MARTAARGTAMALPLGVAGSTISWADRLTSRTDVVHIAARRRIDGK